MEAASPPPDQARTPERNQAALYRAVLLAAGLVVVGMAFQELVTLLVAVLITVIIAIVLASVADRLERRRVPRAIGALVALLAGVAALTGLMFLIVPPMWDEVERFVENVPEITDSLNDRFNDVAGVDREERDANRVQEYLQDYVDDPSRLLGPIASIGLGVAGVLGALLVMLLTAYYIAIRPQPLLDGIVSLFPPDRRVWAVHVMERLRSAWMGWVRGVGVDMIVTGVLVYVGLSLIGLEYAVLFAALSALLVVVPYFGAIAGAIPPILYALSHSPEKAALTLVVYVAIQQIESNVIVPIVMAQAVKLHPAVIAVGVLMVAQLFGTIGLFVAVPILSAAVILVDELWVKRVERRARDSLELPADALDDAEEAAEPPQELIVPR
jgi:predicted PurR-regulated permease PerM